VPDGAGSLEPAEAPELAEAETAGDSETTDAEPIGVPKGTDFVGCGLAEFVDRAGVVARGA